MGKWKQNPLGQKGEKPGLSWGSRRGEALLRGGAKDEAPGSYVFPSEAAKAQGTGDEFMQQETVTHVLLLSGACPCGGGSLLSSPGSLHPRLVLGLSSLSSPLGSFP